MTKPLFLKSLKYTLLLLWICSNTLWAHHQPDTLPINAEERRLLTTSSQYSPSNAHDEKKPTQTLASVLASAPSFKELKTLVLESGLTLWSVNTDHQNLYRARLAGRIHIKQQKANFSLSTEQRRELLTLYELSSRGMLSASFLNAGSINLLIIGLDPSTFDMGNRRRQQPTSLVLNLDEHHWQGNGKNIHSQAVLVPNRFRDFDDGLVEGLLNPFFQNKNLQAIVILTTGNQKQLIFQRYAGRNRSTPIPDNNNTMTSAKPYRPSPPRFQGKSLKGPEFLASSQPDSSFFRVKLPWSVIDNRTISTLTGTKTIEDVEEVFEEVSVTGSSGGYLPNELTYRALLLKQQLNSPVKVFHLQLPQFNNQKENLTNNVFQLEQILSALISPSVSGSVSD
ncbi:hypothetical protein [Parendozoicomonas sp. Alg238-R29]|uniref:hypothetical protein n=1 Tax=Parendozoicomonas sp. Alg238-R29 TaxID=2993446 RepID=UPI00248DDBE4|nr:hypothetical protein [Parendozoicomonas sp. Alg238-R29]